MKNTMKNQTPGVMSLLLTAAVFTGAALPAHADDTTNAPAPDASVAAPSTAPASTIAQNAAPEAAPWQFGVSVPLWAAGISGNATILGHQQNVDVDFQQLRDHLDASFSLALNVQKDKFGLFGNVGYMKFSGDAFGPGPGSANASAVLKFLIFNTGASYLLVKTGEEHPFLLAATAGVRYWYTDTSITLTGPLGNVVFKGGKTYDLWDPVIGLRASQYITRKLHLDFQGDIGGFDVNNDTDFTWSAAGVVTYDFFKWFSLSAGYQALAIDESNGSGASKNGLNLIFSGALITATVKF